MNYSYEIKDDIYHIENDKQIIEFINNKYNRIWYLTVLRKKFYPLEFDSFQRTRNWVLQNHPELLL
jgi:hypothetical protein